jgi:hypothetical protein
LLFSYICFGVGERGGKGHSRSLATKVNQALSEFTSSNDCHPRLTETRPIRKNARKKINNDFNIAARVSAKIEEGDVRGAVRLSVSDDSLAPFSESTVEALRKLHPSLLQQPIHLRSQNLIPPVQMC